MKDVQETVQETQVSDRGDTQVVRERTANTSTEGTRTTVTNVIYLILGFIEVLLGFRFILKLLGANPASGFVDLVYDLSGIFMAPFDAIFSSTTTEGDVTSGVFEPAIIVAMLVYAVIAWGIAKLANVDKAAETQ